MLVKGFPSVVVKHSGPDVRRIPAVLRHQMHDPLQKTISSGDYGYTEE